MSDDKTLLLNQEQINQKINRLAWQVYEDNPGEKELVIAGISPNGYKLAQLLSAKLNEITESSVITGKIEVADKDDPLGQPISINLPKENLENKTVIVVDDVLNSGKTLIYALGVFSQIRLRKLRTVILIDRNHRRYPVSPDFTGLSLATTLQEHVSVILDDKGNNAVYLS